MQQPRRISLGDWRIWVLLGALALVLVVAGVAWLPSFTTSGASFCLSCHAQGDTPDMGRPSLVHPPFSEVGCTQCHAEPGQFIVTHLYREGVEATWERVSGNCTRCHEDILDKEVADFKSNVMNVSIPHRLHVEEFNVLCAQCHRNVAHDWNSPQTNRPRMEYCYECHTQREDCLKCHTSGIPPGRIPLLPVATSSPAPRVPHILDGRSNCLVCHNANGLKPPPETHEGRQPDLCRSCHELSEAVATGSAPRPPQIPHSVERRDNCLLCHGPTGLKPAPEGHTGRAKEVCRLCHQPMTTPTAPLPSAIPHNLDGRANCLLCHGSDGLKPLPASHEKRTLDMCLVCHQPGPVTAPSTPPPAPEGPPQIPHQVEADTDCLLCHASGGLKPFPADHEGRTRETCSLCHQPSQPAEAPAESPPAPVGPPQIPHQVEADTDCLLCHASGGLRPFPADHEGRTRDTCRLCHQPKQ